MKRKEVLKLIAFICMIFIVESILASGGGGGGHGLLDIVTSKNFIEPIEKKSNETI